MSRRTIVAVAAAVVVAGGGAGTTMLVRHRPAALPGTAASVPATKADEEAFLGATAAHLCNVSSTVFDNPKAMSEAYAANPAYPGLNAAQVESLQLRLTTDRGFAARLTAQLRAACRQPARP